jgi:hypothetical protein
LCLKTRPLLRSHLIPAAMYKYLLDPKKKNDNPVVVGRKVTATTSKQVVDYLLCSSCEDLFNKRGESWMLKQVWNGKQFPLLDRLNVAHPYCTFSEVVAFSGSAVGIDTDSLGYFALSILWRAAVHVWNTPFGGKTTLLDLGPVEKPIREFLLGEQPFPDDVAIMVHICTDSSSRGSFHVPSRVQANPIPSFGFQTLGVMFRIYVGNIIPGNIRALCCVTSDNKLIFLRDCSEKTIEAFGQLMRTSRPAKGM